MDRCHNLRFIVCYKYYLRMYADINGLSNKCRVLCECYPILTTISNTPFSFNFRHMVLLVGMDNEGHVEAMLKAIMFEGLKYMTRKDAVLDPRTGNMENGHAPILVTIPPEIPH